MSMDFMTRQKTVVGTPSIQPLPSETGRTDYRMKQNSVFTNLEHGTTSDLMVASPVGFNAPNPMDFSGVPVSDTVPTGIPSVKWSNAPTNKGGCN